MTGTWRAANDRAREVGWRAATREHERLGTDRSRRINIFGIIERANLWLMFQPLKNVFGTYVRVDKIGGIVIHVGHPQSLQRFTAAHEYGHHVLGHEWSVDEAAQIGLEPRPLTPQEAMAQAFAANFLMPLQLVNTELRRIGLPNKPDHLSPRQVYLLALEFGVSYRAAVTQLATLKTITEQVAAELRRQEPKAVKEEIGRGVRPENVRADVWPLESHDSGRLLYPRVDDELRLALPETPSTGFVWTVNGPGIVDQRGGEVPPERLDGASFALARDEFEPRGMSDQGLRFGAGGTRHLVYRVLQPGRHALQLVKRRPWQRDATVAETFEIELEVAPNPTGDSGQGLTERVKSLAAA